MLGPKAERPKYGFQAALAGKLLASKKFIHLLS